MIRDIIVELLEYCDSAGLVPEGGFVNKPVKWMVCFNKDGKYLNLIPTSSEKVGKLYTCPELSQKALRNKHVDGSGRAHFLVESFKTVALADVDKGDTSKVILSTKKLAVAKYKYFLYLLRSASKVYSALQKVADELANPDILTRIHADMMKHSVTEKDSCSIQVDAQVLLDCPELMEWWREARLTEDNTAVSVKGQKRKRCMITGDLVIPCGSHPKIKIGKGTGNALVSFDKDAFQSYGQKGSLNCVMSAETAVRYRAAFHDLLQNHRKMFQDLNVLYWYKKDVKAKLAADEDLLSFVVDPPAAVEASAYISAKKLFDAISQGGRPELSEARFCLFTFLTPQSRIAVRGVIEDSLLNLAQNTIKWFDDFRVTCDFYKDPRFYEVVAASSRDRSKSKKARVPSVLVERLWDAALTGSPLPMNTLGQVVHEVKTNLMAWSTKPFIRAGEETARTKTLKKRKAKDENGTDKKSEYVNLARLGFLKAALIRSGKGEGLMAGLNENHPSTAYQCGRLLSVLYNLQCFTMGALGTTLIDKYYGVLSTSPSLAFGRLVQQSMVYIRKLDNPAWAEEKVGNIMVKISAVPKTFSMEEQALFALGYFQQLIADRAAAKERKAAKEHKGEAN